MPYFVECFSYIQEDGPSFIRVPVIKWLILMAMLSGRQALVGFKEFRIIFLSFMLIPIVRMHTDTDTVAPTLTLTLSLSLSLSLLPTDHHNDVCTMGRRTDVGTEHSGFVYLYLISARTTCAIQMSRHWDEPRRPASVRADEICTGTAVSPSPVRQSAVYVMGHPYSM